MLGAMPEEKAIKCGEGNVNPSATLCVQLNQGEIYYKDKQEDWRNPEKISFAVAQDSHLQRVTIPEAAYVKFASLTS
jgi:hypothetical protein